MVDAKNHPGRILKTYLAQTPNLKKTPSADAKNPPISNSKSPPSTDAKNPTSANAKNSLVLKFHSILILQTNLSELQVAPGTGLKHKTQQQ
ncbi:hypothetical protein ElyMa_005173800 [Elysia marginata]|uniref:DET1- and DDB1-associated protein 1 n=1 Tax=Elysia marginata TaxID=1093978 RepID=A0AAV4JTL8_9GAST|nr:hypothetical protein ElyMa_005173800 [Elysia marginata]